jgi:hypothetical protein
VLGAILQARLRADLEGPAGGPGRVLDTLSDGDLAGGLALAPAAGRDALHAATTSRTARPSASSCSWRRAWRSPAPR